MPKTDPRIAAVGAVEELNAQLGVVLAGEPGELRAPLERVQNELFDLGADLAVPFAEGDGKLRIEQAQVDGLEELLRPVQRRPLEPLKSFVLPGGTEAAARLHLARTVCRRAELAALPVSPANPLALDVPEPAVRPAVHPRASRERRGGGAALEARRVPNIGTVPGGDCPRRNACITTQRVRSSGSDPGKPPPHGE